MLLRPQQCDRTGTEEKKKGPTLNSCPGACVDVCRPALCVLSFDRNSIAQRSALRPPSSSPPTPRARVRVGRERAGQGRKPGGKGKAPGLVLEGGGRERETTQSGRVGKAPSVGG